MRNYGSNALGVVVLVVDLRLCHVDELLKFGNLEFEKVNCGLSGDRLSLESSRKLKRRLKLWPERVLRQRWTISSGVWDLDFDRQ
jgi:hypothetical protein